MEKRFNFTKRVLEKIEATSEVSTYHDTKLKELKLVVQPTGTKKFIFNRRINGRPERIKLGRFPDLTIENARNKVSEINTKIAKGINPKAEKIQETNEQTLNEFFGDYLDRYLKVHNLSWGKDEKRYKRHIKPWGGARKLSSFKKSEIKVLHSDISKNNGKTEANRVVSILQGMFSRAIEWGWEHPNPVSRIGKNPEKKRRRYIQPYEVESVFKAIALEENEIMRDAIWMMLFTAQRKCNVLAMRWSELDLKNAIWTIPNTKNGEPHTLKLVPEALAIL